MICLVLDRLLDFSCEVDRVRLSASSRVGVSLWNVSSQRKQYKIMYFIGILSWLQTNCLQGVDLNVVDTVGRHERMVLCSRWSC